LWVARYLRPQSQVCTTPLQHARSPLSVKLVSQWLCAIGKERGMVGVAGTTTRSHIPTHAILRTGSRPGSAGAGSTARGCG
jgi:hypothetical protein